MTSDTFTDALCDDEKSLEISNAGVYPYHEGGKGDILEALNSPGVQNIIEHFASEGYEYDEGNSFVVIGSAVPEGYLISLRPRIDILFKFKEENQILR